MCSQRRIRARARSRAKYPDGHVATLFSYADRRDDLFSPAHFGDDAVARRISGSPTQPADCDDRGAPLTLGARSEESRRRATSLLLLSSLLRWQPLTSALGGSADTLGCGGGGGGDTAGIGAALACGLPPPAAPTPQDSGNGVVPASGGPPLGSSCIPTKRLPVGVTDPTTGTTNRDYITVVPLVTGNPATGLSATATIQSPVPIGSPKGPTTVAVPAEPVKTAAQQNADYYSSAQGIADQLNAYQQQEIAAASDTAFQNPSAAIAALLKVPQYTAANFYEPVSPTGGGS